jgi:hypothetical protein
MTEGVDTSDEANRFLLDTTTRALIRAVGDKAAAKWLAEEYIRGLEGLLPGPKLDLIRKTLNLPPNTTKNDITILQEKYEKSFKGIDINSWEYGKSLAER